MSCPCDLREHPAPLEIPSGLSVLPRQMARFEAFLHDMRRAVGGFPALDDWSGHAPGDLGEMLFEFWAYVCEVQAFYDQVRANEAYLPTAGGSAALSRLVALLGYRPRPAVAASVYLALEASGVRPLVLPAGTAFRSGPVGGASPQVFELDGGLTVHPALGALALDPPPPADLAEAMGLPADAGEIERLYAIPGSLRAKAGDVVVAQRRSDRAVLAAGRVKAVTRQRFGDEKDYALLDLDPPLALAPDMAMEDLALLTPALTAGLWTASSVAGDPAALADDGESVVLAGLERAVRAGQAVALWNDGTLAAALVETATDRQMTLSAATTATATSEDGDAIDIAVPAVRVPATRLTFDRALPLSGPAASVTVGFGMVEAATLAGPPRDEVAVAPMSELPFQAPWRFRRRWRTADPVDVTALLVDPFGAGAAVGATLDPESGRLKLGQDAPELDLAQPVTAYGNAARASRGETVRDEELGYGDGSLANQAFVLKKSPLTYLPAPTGSAVTSTLTVRVDGVEWREVDSFYGVAASARVFVVRQTEEGDSQVVFGDGESGGARLPTGARVTADYRFGAGAALPEAGSISQMVDPVEAVTAVRQPFGAFGGADAEGSDTLREAAPASALLIGRAVSMADFEAAARLEPGVLAAMAVWHWSQRRQRPVARVWYAGDEAIAGDLTRRLRALCDPSTPIDAVPAEPLAIALAIQVEIAQGHREADVLAAVRAALVGAGGRLDPDRPQIGAPLLRSPLIAEIVAVEGTWTVPQILVSGEGLPDPVGLQDLGLRCPAGRWFTVEAGLGGSLRLNGEEAG